MAAQNQGYLRRLWHEYCLGSSVYPSRYLAMQQLTMAERLWWVFWLSSAIAACILSVVLAYRQWASSPVYISYGNNLVPTWDIPFPAVTICPMTQTKVEYLNLSDAYRRLNDDVELENYEYVYLRAVTHVCPMVDLWYTFYEPLRMDVIKVLQSIAIPMEDMFAACRLRKVQVPCSAIISQSITQLGICYTFNAISSDDLFKKDNLQREYSYSSANIKSEGWTLEDGYPHTGDANTYPFRPIGIGKKSSLGLVLISRKIDQDSCCNGPFNGYYVSVHRPDEVPLFRSQYFRLPHLSFLSLNIKPELTFISKALQKNNFERRQCYFSGERELRYFKVYNYNNCLLECIANYTLQQCGCVSFDMPRSAEVHVCDASEKFCYEDAADDVVASYDELNTTDEWQEPCGCVPPCTTLKYDVEIYRLPLDFNSFAKAAGNLSRNYTGIEPAMLNIGFKNNWMLPLQRREMMGLSDILSHFGGLFGLLMGASVISLLELLYFCFVRPCRNDIPADSTGVRQVLPWRP
ncbi:pickpocket protein 28-like [Topomyia yanbarensis]|uniref:pickpocket protein 28-like n=1 Tax=Topomyia yanbarensis TaxID=2498891 RepID=UPI00273C76D1|nr:pickpocket protein 28-like [Topomyia yanbarensis]